MNTLMKINKELVLSDVVKEKAAAKAAAKTFFLIDTSGSMLDELDGTPKIQHVRNLVEEIRNHNIVSFSTRVYMGYKEEFQSTNMHIAFKFIGNQKPRRVIVISDGLPNNPSETIEAARALSIPIEIIYIGPPNSPGESFMKTLANLTGGKEATVKPQELTRQVRLLLTYKA